MADDELGIIVGSVAVTVVPAAGKFAALLGGEVTPQADALGKNIGEHLSKIIAKSIGEGLRDGLKDAPTGPASETGARTGGAFANAFKDRVKAALRDLPSPNLLIDDTALGAQLFDIRARMKALGDAKIGVDIDETAALAEIELLHGRLVALSAESPSIQVRVDAGKAIAQLEAVRALARSVSNEFAPIEGFRSETILPELEGVAAGAQRATGSLSGLTTTAIALGPALVPIDAALIGGLAGGAAVLASLAGGLGVVALGAKEVANEVKGEVLPAIHELQHTAAQGLLPGVEASIHSLLTLVPELDHFINSLAQDIGHLAAEGGAALTGPYWQQFFSFVDAEAGPIIVQFGHIIGNLAHGFAGLVEAFSPVTHQIGDGLERLSEQFAGFGAGAGSNTGFQAFLSYIETEGPLVAHTLSDLFVALGHVAEAVGPLGHLTLTLIDDLALLVAALPTPALTALAGGFIAATVAAKAFAIAQGLALAPELLLVGAIAAVGIAFYEAYEKIEPFRDIVNELAHIGDIAVNVVVSILGDIPGFDWLKEHLPSGGGGGKDWETAPGGGLTPDQEAALEANGAGVFARLRAQAAAPSVAAAQTALAGFYAALSQSGAFNAFTAHVDEISTHVRSAADNTESAAHRIDKAISDAVAPAVTNLTGLMNVLGAAQARANNREFHAIVSHQAALDAADYATALAAVAVQSGAAATQAKSLADAIDDSTDAGKAAKATAESLAQALADKAKADQTAADSAKVSAAAQEAAYQRIAHAAEAATADATAAARALVANLQQTTDQILAQARQFSQSISSGLTEGTDLASIWRSLVGTDENGNPTSPTVTQVKAALDATLKSVANFSGELKQIADAGGSKSLITQILGLDPADREGFAKALLVAGPDVIKQFSGLYGQINKLADAQGEAIAKSFYGDGIHSMEQLIKGIVSKFPDLAKALQPLIRSLREAFTITPIITAPVLHHGGGGKGGKGASIGYSGGNVAALVSASRVSSAAALSAGGGLGDLTVYAQFGEETIEARSVRVAHGVVNAKVAAGKQLEDAGMPGSALTHLAAT